MSGSGGCRDASHRPHWRVETRNGNYSAFNGYRFTPSAYSSVVCLIDRLRWRTTAAYVTELEDLD